MKLIHFFCLAFCFSTSLFAQITKDVTVETFGIFGQGRASDPASYYFLQSEGDLAKIKVSSANTGGIINVEKVGGYVYFNLEGTSKYLKFTTTNNQVKWVDGKDDNSKWKEITAIQPGADKSWKSYVLSTNESLFLRHTGFVMYAHARVENATFYGDATWRIEGGMLVPPAGCANATAYGKKQLQTYAIVNQTTNNFFAGINTAGKCGIIDKTQSSTGVILSLEIRYKKTLNCAVLIDSESGKYITTDASGNISLTIDEQAGSYWTVSAARQTGLDATWFSLKSNHPSLADHYLRHAALVMYAHPATLAAEYFKGDASWKFIETVIGTTTTTPSTTVTAMVPNIALGDAVWNIGTGIVGGDFTACTVVKDANNVRLVSKTGDWHGIHKNNGTANHTASEGLVFKPGKIVMHPGNGADHLTKIKFTAPTDGEYNFSAKWTAIDLQAKKSWTWVMTNAASQVGTTYPFTPAGYKEIHTVGITGVNGTASFNRTIKLKAGEVVMFEIGNGGDGWLDDALETEIVVVKQ